MVSYFHSIYESIYSKLGKHLVKVPDENHINYKNSDSYLHACSHVYPNGLDVMFVRGKIKEEIRIKKEMTGIPDQLVCSFMINVKHLKTYYLNGMQAELTDRDVMLFHNRHAGLSGLINPDVEFLILAVRIHGHMFEKVKSIIQNHIPNLYDEQGELLFIKDSISPEISKALVGMDRFLSMPSDLFIPYLGAKAQEMCSMGLYEVVMTNSELIKYSISNEKLELANRVRLLILEDLSRHLSISEIASEIGASETLIKEVFQLVNGVPIYTFYQNRRLDKSIQMLQNKRYSITEIAYQLGFSSPSNFSKFFKKMTKMTPKQYYRNEAL